MKESFGIREICRETVLGYMFWSMIEALTPMIWFYPLNAMEVSGYEVFLLLLFSPILLGPAWIRKRFQTRASMGLFRILTVAALGSFQAPDTLSRLVILSLGNFCVMLVFTGSMWSPSAHQRFVTFWGLILGKFALLTSRIWYTTYVPTWHDTASNTAVITLGVIATIDKILSGDDGRSSEWKQPPGSLPAPFVGVAIGFGSQLFLTHWVFGDVSVLSRWTGAGHPDTGPTPYQSGFLVLICLFIGVLMSFNLHKVSRLGWWMTGMLGILCLNYLMKWQAFCGGLILAVFTISLWPSMAEKLYHCSPGRTMALVVLTWIVEILHEVWTVAYNFVPGGVFTREHTDHLIVMVMLGLLAGLTAGRQKESMFTESREKRQKVVKTLLLMVLIGAGGYASRYHKQDISHLPELHQEADFTAAVWAFHFGYDNRGWPSVMPSSDFIRDTGADVIGLLETDASKPFMGNNDLVMWLAEKLQMYSDFGLPTRDHCWGVAFLSKYPIVKSSQLMLPSPHGELAPAIMATVNMTGNMVDFVVTHMGNDWDTLDRELQAKELSRLLRETENPVVFLGYVTSKPGSRDYKRLLSEGNVKDIDDTDRKRFCEYIMYRGLKRLGYARVSHGGLSDTELQMARFHIPENKQFTDNDMIKTRPKQVAHKFRFNPSFGKYRDGHNWIENHNFHMSTPKYFVPKE